MSNQNRVKIVTPISLLHVCIIAIRIEFVTDELAASIFSKGIAQIMRSANILKWIKTIVQTINYTLRMISYS